MTSQASSEETRDRSKTTSTEISNSCLVSFISHLQSVMALTFVTFSLHTLHIVKVNKIPILYVSSLLQDKNISLPHLDILNWKLNKSVPIGCFFINCQINFRFCGVRLIIFCTFLYIICRFYKNY